LPSEHYILQARRGWVWAIARCAFCVAWALFACEMFLRIFAPQPLIPRNVSAAPFGIRVNTPNSRYWQRTPEVNVELRINSQGIRADEEIPLEKPPGVQRIVVLGDSYAMGYEVDLKDTFTTRLTEDLATAGKRVQIVNLSVSGYGNAEELIMLRNRGLAFHPDLVLLAWHPTDYDDNTRSQLFALRDGKLVPDQPTYLPGVQVRQMLDRIPGYGWVEANSHLYSFVREAAAGKVKDILVAMHGQGPADDPSAAKPDAATPATTSSPTTAPSVVEPSYSERLAVALLAQIKAESQSNGAKLLILDVPTWISRTKWISQFPPSAQTAPSRFDVVSPLPLFEQHVGEKLFWERGHYHFTIVGCRLVGQALAERILQEKLLE
jgi:hypothetical protein